MSTAYASRLEIAGVEYVPAVKVAELVAALEAVRETVVPQCLAWYVADNTLKKHQGETA